MVLFSSDRGFRWWLYTASHSQFLLRSPRHDEDNENVDVVFLAVFYADMPILLRGLTVDEPTNAEIEMLTNKTGIAPDEHHSYFAIETQGKRFFVGAYSMRTSTNKLEHHDPGF